MCGHKAGFKEPLLPLALLTIVISMQLQQAPPQHQPYSAQLPRLRCLGRRQLRQHFHSLRSRRSRSRHCRRHSRRSNHRSSRQRSRRQRSYSRRQASRHSS